MPENHLAHLHSSSLRWLTALIAAVFMTACAVAPTFDESQILAPVSQNDLARATASEEEGRKTQAAEQYLKLAAQSQPPARTQLQLKALHAYVSGGKTKDAQTLSASLSSAPLTPIQHQLLLLEQADLAMLSGRPKAAIERLEQMQSRSLPKDLAARRLGTLASAQRLTDKQVAAAESLAELDRVLDSKTARLANQVSLLSTLSMLTQAELQGLTQRGKGSMKGWAEIALIMKNAGNSAERMESGFQTWQRKHSGHPSLPELGRAYADTLGGGYASGEQVTVLLPRSGRFAAAAKAVGDGIKAAHGADKGGQAPKLQFADSSAGVRARHAEAARSGADYVIGPLEKPSVDTLLNTRKLSIPTLALNQASSSQRRAENLFQFALSPENEASEVASAAFGMGAKRALMLYPQGDWGERMASAFRRHWRNLGGTVAGQATYNPKAKSQDASVRKLLTDADADLLFLAATADSARRIYPETQQIGPKALTVIATSHVYSGNFDPIRDKSLIGLYFVDIPWMLDTQANGPLSRRQRIGASANAADPLARLYAMGIDAYRLAPRLTQLSHNPGAYYPGQTGGLSLDKLGRIKRQLSLGRFTPEGPRLADTSGKTQD